MKMLLRASLSALCLLFPGVARADDVPLDVAAIKAKVEAADTTPKAYRQTTVTTSSNGLTTTRRYAQRGDDWRELVDRGPFHTESGEFKGDAWHQNDNGQTVADERDPGEAKPDPTTSVLERVHQPVEAYRLSSLNARGLGTRHYYDPQTWRLVRREAVGANGTIVTTYDDFRADGGRTFAHHWSTANAYAKTTSDTRVTEYDPTVVPDDAVAMPDSRRRLVEFPAGSGPVVLPTAFGAAHVFVRVTIDGRGLDFVLDTGADGITIDTTVAQQLGLPRCGERSAVTAGRYTTARTIVPEMRVGKLTMRNVAVQIVPDGTNEMTGVKTVGLLGFDFLAELGATIDYEHERVTVVPEPQFAAPVGPVVFPLDVRIGDGSPYVNVTINGALAERFMLDTGGAGTFLILDGFVRKHPEVLQDMGRGDGRELELEGIGGRIPTQPIQLRSLKLGPIDFQEFVGYRVTSAGVYEGDDDGVIGSDFLRLFTLGLDYANSRVYLVPNSIGRKAMGIKG